MVCESLFVLIGSVCSWTVEEMSDDVEGDPPLMNFFLMVRYAKNGISVRLYVRPDILTVSRTLAQVR